MHRSRLCLPLSLDLFLDKPSSQLGHLLDLSWESIAVILRARGCPLKCYKGDHQDPPDTCHPLDTWDPPDTWDFLPLEWVHHQDRYVMHYTRFDKFPLPPLVLSPPFFQCAIFLVCSIQCIPRLLSIPIHHRCSSTLLKCRSAQYTFPFQF